ncbi:hypothetical protein ACWD4O_17465 [Streptomyces sp. NPDC002623]
MTTCVGAALDVVPGEAVTVVTGRTDARALPTLLDASTDCEAGRGMALVDAIADRWGVQLHADRKVTWCELATGLAVPYGHRGTLHVSRAERVLDLYREGQLIRTVQRSRLRATVAEMAAIDAIVDLLHWLHAQGRDVDEALD